MNDPASEASALTARSAAPKATVPLPSGPIGRLLASVGNLSYLLNAIHTQYAQDNGLGTRAIHTLSAISEGHVTPGELARLMLLPPSVVSGDLNQLRDAGLIRRDRDPRDGRRLVYGLTAPGETMLAGAHRLFVQLLGEKLQSHPEAEVASALRLLYNLTRQLRESMG